MEFQRQQVYDWNQTAAVVMEHNSRMMQLMFAYVSGSTTGTRQIPTMEPPPPPPGPQPVVPMFEQFLADHYNVTPVSTSPTYSTTTSRLFNTIIYCLTISFQTCREPVVVLLMVPLLSHGAQSLRSGLAAAVAVALALAVVVTTSALAASALAVEVMPLKPFIVIKVDLR